MQRSYLTLPIFQQFAIFRLYVTQVNLGLSFNQIPLHYLLQYWLLELRVLEGDLRI